MTLQPEPLDRGTMMTRLLESHSALDYRNLRGPSVDQVQDLLVRKDTQLDRIRLKAASYLSF